MANGTGQRMVRSQGSFNAAQDPSLIPVTFRRTFVQRLGATSGVPTDGTVANIDVDEIDVGWVRNEIAKLLQPDYTVNDLFYKGDHWQQGEGWSGPRPTTTDETAIEVMAQIAKAFVSKNCIREVTNRAANGVAGREPVWSFAQRNKAVDEAAEPTGEGDLGEVETLLTEWWDKRKIHRLLWRVVKTALLGERATLRVFIPAGLRDTLGVVTVPEGDMEAALDHIYVHDPDYAAAGVITDTATMRQIGAYVWKDGETERAEISVLAVTEEAPDERVTVIRTVTGGKKTTTVLGQGTRTEGSDVTIDQMIVPLNGHLTIFELSIPKLVTEQVRQLQRSINKALTMGDRNTELGGFLERTVTNGQMPGHYEDVPAANGQPATKRFVRDDMQIGGGAVNFFVGYPIYDRDGNVSGYTSPNMVYKDPVSPENFDKTQMMFYRALLEETHQLHYLLAGEQYASGESRKQARADFEDDIRAYRGAINEMGRWLLEVVLAMAEWLANIEGRYSQRYRAVFNARLNPGPATAEAINSAVNLYNNDGLSQEGMMEWAGVDDVDAEIERIRKNRAEGFGRQPDAPAPGPPNINRNRGPGNTPPSNGNQPPQPAPTNVGRPQGARTGQQTNPPQQN